MIYIGIDPGKTGAVGVLGEGPAMVFDMAEALPELENLRYRLRIDGPRECKALVEEQHQRPTDGKKQGSTLMIQYGRIQGWLDVLAIPYELITPAKWRKVVFDSAPKGDTKAMSLDLARRLFPELRGQLERKMDHNRAEAMLIAEVCRRKGGD